MTNTGTIQIASAKCKYFLRQCVTQNYLVHPNSQQPAEYTFSEKSLKILNNLLKSVGGFKKHLMFQPIWIDRGRLPLIMPTESNYKFSEDDFFNDKGLIFDWNPLVACVYKYAIEKSKHDKILQQISPYASLSYSCSSTQNSALDSVFSHWISVRSNRALTPAQIKHYSTMIMFHRINAWRNALNNTFTIFSKMNDDYCLKEFGVDSRFKGSIRMGELPWCPVVERVFHLLDKQSGPPINMFLSITNAPRMLLTVINDMIDSHTRNTNYNSLHTKLSPLKITLIKVDGTLDAGFFNDIVNHLKTLNISYDVVVKDIHSQATFEPYNSDFALLLDPIYLKNGFIGIIESCSGLMKILKLELLLEYLKTFYD